MFFWGAGVVLVVSFVALGSLWRNPLLERHEGGRALGASVSRIVLSRGLRIVVQAFSAGLFVLVFSAAIFGDGDVSRNLAPTWIYVGFWLGAPLLSVLFGNVWRALSPWRAIADFGVWVIERTGRTAQPLAVYPERLGRWPGAIALFCFVTLELAYADPGDPRVLAFATAIYTYATLFGMAAFGRETWTRSGEGFAILFAYFARGAPMTVRDGRLAIRWPFTGLAGSEPVAGSLAFIAVMLGSVAFDGFSRTTWWTDLVYEIEQPHLITNPGLGELYVTFVNITGLVVVIAVVASAYLVACAAARSMVAAPRSLEPDFLLSLIPIAFVYMVAHYFTFFVNQGQFLIPLFSDPFGKGWDLFGTADYQATPAPISPNVVWYAQAISLVVGHVAGLAIAHDRAVALFPDKRAALRSQYAMLALMVLYTVGGLWLLSRG